MSSQSTGLLRWADELESGKWRQAYGYLADAQGGRCAIGCLHEAFGAIGLPVNWSTGENFDTLAKVWRPAEERIVREVHRLRPDTRHIREIALLNDNARVDFPTFARAIRTVARQLEEEEYGVPIVASEPARELVEVA